MRDDLFIGITTWNDEAFLSACLESLTKTLEGVTYVLYVSDNNSQDNTCKIARQFTQNIIVGRNTQANALNGLVAKSQARYSLLIHSDIVMLNPDWYQICSAHVDKQHVLVSPEDIGLGNYERPFGAGMPESSFMLFDTAWLKSARHFSIKRMVKRALGRRQATAYGFDFYGAHVTHNIPKVIRRSDKSWTMMKVFPSRLHASPVHAPAIASSTSDAASRTYGFGNFYAMDGVVTHYHNWFARWKSQFGRTNSRWGIPSGMIESYSLRFLRDYANNCVELPRDLNCSAGAMSACSELAAEGPRKPQRA